MTHWLYSANVKYYDVLAAFKQNKTYWPRNSNVSKGDKVYIYLSAPYRQIGFICEVTEINLPREVVFEKVHPFFNNPREMKSSIKLFMGLRVKLTLPLEEGSLLSLYHLKENGLRGMLQGPRRLENNFELLQYIQRCVP